MNGDGQNTELVTKGAMYETWLNGRRVIIDIPDGAPAKHYSGAWYEVELPEKNRSALVDLCTLEERAGVLNRQSKE